VKAGSSWPFQPVTNAQLRDLIVSLKAQLHDVNHEIRHEISAFKTEMRERLMATQADVDALTQKVSDLGTALASDVTAITDEIAALQSANPSLDLSALSSAVDGLSTNVDAVTAIPGDGSTPTPVDPGA
jgi:hypothetical protein